ncbi:pyridine nucleotide-disulfide oxidoreductase [Helicobacter sp. 13S00482-2]|uniref:FAD-dependent oxidoreductase n=1 Tax=Helicobacter sp. 13S00482-2 TaxID=1476200 RepID=UPI000BA6ADCE|nr:FAD-dependent oxidoreductase [Helicobacter sp. 13S00482-2]PAF54255.1 pyridine nucleotide-disulfide oxidoreductase [Helicobacter sp. 13S00482-2]
MQEFDIVIIGFGKAGKTLALKSAAKGKKVALIEKSKKMYGGTCINIGCIPTKKLVYQSHLSKMTPTYSYAQSIENKNKLILALREKNYQNLIQQPNITIFDGKASFLDSKTICIEGEEKLQIKGEKIFINTGSKSFIPDMPIKSKKVYTSTELLDLDVLPTKLLIIGGGYIGLEFASMYANFGSKVSVLIRKNQLMPKEDEDIAASVEACLEKMGIEIIYEAVPISIEDEDEKVKISFDKEGRTNHILGDAVLFATGRKAYTEGLNLQKAGVAINNQGEIITNEFLRTNIENIYALGDVKGGPLFTYISLDDFRIVFDLIFGNGKRSVKNRPAVPEVIFLDTPLACVGLKEKEALAKGYEIKIAKLSAEAIPAARVLNNTQGMLKVIIDAKTDLILGASLHCQNSPEIINIFSLAINAKQSYVVLKDMIFTHPSMSEAINDLFGNIK